MNKKVIKNDIELLNTVTSNMKKQYFLDYVMSNDINGASVSFNVTDVDISDLEETTASIFIYTRDGSIFESDNVERKETEYIYVFTEEELKHTGEARIQLVVKFPDGKQVTTQLLSVMIEEGLDKKLMNVHKNVMIQSWNELLTEVNEDAKRFNQNENERIENFELSQEQREFAFNLLKNSCEWSFSDAENKRQEDYLSNEATRKNDEDVRLASESARESNELDRMIAEEDRQVAEATRNSSENDRQEAERNRQDTLVQHSILMEFYDEKKANKQQGDFYSPTLLNRWITHTPVRIRKNDFGKVEMFGSIRNGILNTTVIILPEEMRPLHQVFTLANSANNSVAYVTIEPTGYVKLLKGEAGHISLDGISFYTD